MKRAFPDYSDRYLSWLYSCLREISEVHSESDGFIHSRREMRLIYLLYYHVRSSDREIWRLREKSILFPINLGWSYPLRLTARLKWNRGLFSHLLSHFQLTCGKTEEASSNLFICKWPGKMRCQSRRLRLRAHCLTHTMCGLTDRL